ncbi:Cytoplasmic tRNA 2-thiolation protein 2 [Hypsizygus marmoreus]|uniref:Cytoplasmic tRNA 2-thiolation protein 2 n=1 Tax=Hypsizygus marmoreus TaxID=39966 RepID=A0A369K157_HYPMA|nr:Cytoplasmic tRNA 2-thiolation protein 2 [Hypsizygus marmoreus]
MSTSCGNPETDKDSIMARRPKFDKSKECVRCKERLGNIVIRYAVYCKECFFPLIAVKFRRSLDPSINPLPDGPRRKLLNASGNLLIGYSGGLGSTVLLDLVNRTYFAPPEEAIDGKPRGGRDHPRNTSVWGNGAVCYIETCNAFPGMKDRTQEIRAVVEKYDRFNLIPLRIEDAFDPIWWGKIGGLSPVTHFGMDVTNEDLFLSTLISAEESESPKSRLQKFISSLPTQTAIPSAVQTLTRLLLLHTAMSMGSSHLLLGTSLTSLSISLISSISQGGGFAVREEAQEEWAPRISLRSRVSNGHKDGVIRIIRPLRDIGMKECAIWAWWNGLDVVGRERFPGGQQSIGPMTKDFIVGLERDYPSTVSTIARTCAKLTPKQGTSGTCALCERPAQSGIQDWKASISIRSFKDLPSSYPHRPGHLSTSDSSGTTQRPSTSLTPFLCYSCHTTLTSRSSRGNTANISSTHNPVPLPMWVASTLNPIPPAPREEAPSDIVESDEVWGRTKMESEQMKAVVADFLLDE